MNYISTMCVALAISFGTSSISAADLTNISAAVKGGKIFLDDNDDLGDATIDEKTAIGFYIGYDFAPNWTAEFEYVKGEFEISDTISRVTADGVNRFAIKRWRNKSVRWVFQKF